MKHDPFDYFRESGSGFLPKTSSAALRALEARMVPPEAYVHEAISVKPLNEEPFDLDAIERTLGRTDLEVETNLLLMRILEQLVSNSEQEVALFAAESINLIESRYSTKIERIKDDPTQRSTSTGLAELSELYSDFAQLYPRNSSLRSFYMKEAYNALVELNRRKELDGTTRERIVRVLLDLGLLDQALKVVRQLNPGESIAFSLLEAEVEFERRNFVRVHEICRSLEPLRLALTDEQLAVVDFWLADQ